MHTTTRRRFLLTSGAAAAAAAFGRFDVFAQAGAQAGAQGRGGQPPAPIDPVVREIRRSVGTWTARGGTIGWLINADGAVAVDSQFPDTAAPCVEHLLKASGRGEIAALINSHHHGDHTGGNGVFRPRTKQIIGHANVPTYMQSTYDAAVARRKEQPNPVGPEPTLPAVPDRTLTNALTLDHGDERIHIRHFGPAHTGGDVVIAFERANVAHMGDLMFNRMHPVIDRVNGASIQGWIGVLERVAKDLPADTIYIFGHAAPKREVTGSRDDLLRHAAYLVALLDYVRAEVKAGKTRDQVVASTEVIQGFDDYGPLVARPLGPAYDEVTAKRL